MKDSEHDLKKEYIKGLIAIGESDQKSVLLYVGFNLAVVSLVLSEKVSFSSEESASYIVIAALVSMLISAILFFNHYRKIHLSSFRLVEQLLTLDVDRAKAVQVETWGRNKIGNRLAYVTCTVGVALLTVAYIVQ